MNVSDFDFELPAELIAQEPAAAREGSRLLVLSRESGSIAHASFGEFPRFMRAGDLLVVNDTRVFPARLLGRRVPSGGEVECLLLRRLPTERSERPERLYESLMHPGQKLKPGARVLFERDGISISGEVLARHFHGRRTIRLWTAPGLDVDAAIDRIGHIPLPPYIRRGDSPADRDRYQTVFARARGSVAAPTAGLHFSARLLQALEAQGVERTSVTLHVGYGTFKPVRAERVEDHTVDAETFEVTADAAAALTRARQEGRRIVAVGTTTARVLESLAMGESGVVLPARGDTSLFIHPGHRFQLIDGLITNFHLPRSSLLMLVSAFAGRESVLAAYRKAVEERYRFYSYGDAMLIL
jgi:S-adenosylmethionine:tRNA ribosyltransferase-isomerase